MMSLVRFVKLTLSGAVVAALGCGTGGTMVEHDAGVDAGGAGTGGAGTGGAGTGGMTDAGPDGPDFCGQCAPGPADGWDNPVLLWVGPKKDAPACPLDAPKVAFEGYADLDAPLDCGTCTCTTPTGSCALPGTMTANAASCAQNGGSTPHTLFDPSAGWDGTCDTNASIPSGKLCSGVKCVQSLSVGPLMLNEASGTPSTPPAPAAPTWTTFGRSCKAVPRVPCNGGQGICLASSPPGYRVCIFHGDEKDCTSPSLSPYTEKHVFYDAYQDTRACTPCTCGVPTGSSCASTVSIYTDGACSTLAYSSTVTSSGPACHDLPAGTPLGSKSATAPTYTPGSCAPDGGQPMGAATPTNPSTYCCLPSP
jgi:hypothetical protein